nr:Gag-Pol polyprotein [Tanacetum cinerariifolium]
IHAEEELQGMIDSLDRSNETIAKYLQEYKDFASDLPLEKRIELISNLVKYQENYCKVYKFQSQQRRPMTKKQKRDYYMAMIRNNLGWKVKDFKGMTFEEIEAKFVVVWKHVEDFIPIGSKEEAERLKRKGLNLEQEHVHTEGQRSYWKIIRLGGSSACYQFFIDLLKQLDREDLNQLWALVMEYLNIRPATSEKEMELWVELKRLYEPDPEDQLWTQTQNFIHAPVEWKLYDLCGVHQVTAKDKDIFMLVEKDYPLRKGLAIVMISYKLQVKTYSRMANELVLKIYKIASTPRQQAFSNADHVGCLDTYKSTSGGLQFLGDKLVSWMSKKQDYTAMSSAEVEYVALFASFAQGSDPHQEEIDVTITDDVLPPSVKNDDSDEEVDAVDVLRVDNFIQNSEHEYSESEDSDFDNPPVPLPPTEPPDEGFDFEINFGKEFSVDFP